MCVSYRYFFTCRAPGDERYTLASRCSTAMIYEHPAIVSPPKRVSRRFLSKKSTYAWPCRLLKIPCPPPPPFPPAFVAPEMILEEEHGRPSDMYAFGAILYMLLSGSPLRAATLASAVTPTAPDTSGPAWGGVSPEAKGLVRALMNPTGPAARVSAKQALEHEWINGEEKTLRSRSLDAVLKGARVLSWRGAMTAGERDGGSVMGAIPRTVSLF